MNVELYEADGLVRNSASGIDITVTVSGVSPDVDLNQNGGNTLTITGNNFPNVASYVEVEFSDGTGCTVISSTPTEIQCTIDGFDLTAEDASTARTFSLIDRSPSLGTRRRRLSTRR